ncbi:MAG: YncE family protein [Acidimicrobiales bacterium]|jgi:YVTN family beta-propeller protein
MGIRVSVTRQLSGLAVHLPRHVLGAAAVALLAIVAAGCGSGAPATTTTTTTLPPLPPEVYAYVTMIGTGANVGLGHSVVPVEVSLGGNGPEAALDVGTYPDAIAITPDGKRAYVTNYTSNSVTPIDLGTGKVLPAIQLGSTAGPAGIAITPDGATAYVTDAGASGTLGDTITPIDLATDKTLPPVSVGPGPQGIAITPNGRRAYVTDAGAFVPGQTGSIGSTVTPVDLTTGQALPPIPVGNAPVAIAITPDGSTALVANVNSGSVSPIDLANDKAGSPISVQGGPISIAISPTEPTTAYVADTISGPSTTGNVTVIDLTSDTAGTPITVGKNPQAIAMSPDGSTAWVVCYGSRTLVPLSTKTHLPGAAIHLPGGPYAIAITQRSSAGTVTTTSPKGGSRSKKTKKG